MITDDLPVVLTLTLKFSCLGRFKGFRQKFPKHLEGWKKIYDSNVSDEVLPLIAKISVTSLIVINTPIRELMAGETNKFLLFIDWYI